MIKETNDRICWRTGCHSRATSRGAGGGYYCDDHRRFDWTPARVDELKRFDAEGKSAREIAKLFGDGATRNAVIGKLHRLGLTKTGRRANHYERQRVECRVKSKTGDAKRARKPPPPLPSARLQWGSGSVVGCGKAPESNKTIGPTQASLNIPMWDARFKAGCCKYPTTGEDAETVLFCAVPVAREAIYCPAHAAACLRVEAGHASRTKAKARTGEAFGDLSRPKWWKPQGDVPGVDTLIDPDKQRGKFKSVRFAGFGDGEAA